MKTSKRTITKQSINTFTLLEAVTETARKYLHKNLNMQHFLVKFYFHQLSKLNLELHKKEDHDKPNSTGIVAKLKYMKYYLLEQQQNFSLGRIRELSDSNLYHQMCFRCIFHIHLKEAGEGISQNILVATSATQRSLILVYSRTVQKESKFSNKCLTSLCFFFIIIYFIRFFIFILSICFP